MSDSVAAAPAPAPSAAPAAPKSAPASASSAAPAAASSAAPKTANNAGDAAKNLGVVDPAAPAAPVKQKFKLKVDHQEIEEEYTPEQIQTELQMAKAARKRMQEAAEIRKEWEQLQAAAKENPDLLLKKLAGIEDPKAWAKQKLEAEWKRELMPEHERKLADLQAERDAAKKELEAERGQRKAEYEAKQQAALEQQLEAEFKQAFELSQLPFEGEYLEMFGKIAMEALEYGVELSPAQMAAEVKRQVGERETKQQQALQEKFRALKGDDLLAALSDDVVREVLRASVEKHKRSLAEPVVETPVASRKQPESRVMEPDLESSVYWRRLGM